MDNYDIESQNGKCAMDGSNKVGGDGKHHNQALSTNDSTEPGTQGAHADTGIDVDHLTLDSEIKFNYPGEQDAVGKAQHLRNLYDSLSKTRELEQTVLQQIEQCQGNAVTNMSTAETVPHIVGHMMNHPLHEASSNVQHGPIATSSGIDLTRTQYPNPSIGVRRMKPKIPATYDGKTSWFDYMVHFDMVSEINQWDHATKALELATSLRGQAQTVLSDLRPEQRKSFAHLVSALAARFEPQNLSEMHRAQLKGKLRKTDESLTELAQAIRTLVRKSYPIAVSETTETLARDAFIDSLNESEMEWAVHQGKPCTLDDALRLALEYEAFQIGRSRRLGTKRVRIQRDSSPYHPIVNGKVETQNGQLDCQLKETIARLENLILAQRLPDAKREAFEKRLCFYCQKPGHISRYCKKREHDKGLKPENSQ